MGCPRFTSSHPSTQFGFRLSPRPEIHPPRTKTEGIGRTVALFGLVAVFCLRAAIVFAQEPDGMPRLTLPDKTPDVLSPGIQPDAFLIRNGMGETILVPKVRYEAFERFLSSENERPIPISAELLEQLDVSIKIDDLVARIKIHADAELPEPNSKWLSVPLALGNIQAVPNKSGNEESEFPPLRIANDRSGYVWRLSPGGNGRRKMQFDALSNVRFSPAGNSLRLDLPSVFSVVRLELPLGQWELNVVGNGSEVVEPWGTTETSSIALIRTTGGPVVLNWAKKSTSDLAQAIEVKSLTKYTPQTEAGEFRAISNLTIRGPKNLGGRRFLITLPGDSQWREPTAAASPFPGFRVSMSDQASEKTNPVLMLEFEEAFSRMELELPIEWQTSHSNDANLISFFMPQVEGVQRHIGSIDISVPRNVSFRWDPQAGIQFIKQMLSNDGSEMLTYSFGFSQQMEPVLGKWVEGDLASELKATYNVVCEPSIQRLSGSIEFLGDVRQLPFLQLDVRGWTVDRVQFQPSGQDLNPVLIQSRTTPDQANTQQTTTSVPLSLGELLEANQYKNSALAGSRPTADSMPMPVDPSSPISSSRDEGIRQQNRGISFALSRVNPTDGNLESDKQPIAFSLPMLSWLDPESQQRQSLSVAGELTIQSTFLNLQEGEIQSELKRIVESMWKQTDSSTSASPIAESVGHRTELRYRVTSAKSPLEWNGIAERVGVALQTRCETRLQLSKDELDVSQTWTLTHVDGATVHLRLALPKEWVGAGSKSSDIEKQVGQLELSVDGEAVNGTPVPGKLGASSTSMLTPSLEPRYVWLSIALPEAKGVAVTTRERKLTLRKRIPHREKLTTTPTSFEWLLPWLGSDRAEDSVENVTFAGEVICSEEVRCSIQSPLGGDKKPLSQDQLVGKGLPFDRTNLEPRIVGVQNLLEADGQDCAIVSMWLQTIVNAREQRDRFVYRIKTKSRALSFRLPASQIANAEFLIDGKKVLASLNPNDVQRVDLSLDTLISDKKKPEDDIFVVEIFLWSLNDSQWWKSLRAEAPTLLHCRSRSPLVWQVVLPTTVHLIGNTSTLSPGYRWKWQDLYLRRTSDWNQEKIGNLIGATPQRFVSQETNQYVFFSLDHTVAMRVWAAPRFLLWAPVALFVLIGSFFVMEFTWIKKPWVLVCLLLLSLAFSQWAWDLSIALVQCLTAAIGIAVIYSTLKWLVDRKSRRRSVFALRPAMALNPSAARAPALSGSDVFSKAVASTAASPGSQLVAKTAPPAPPSSDSGVDAGVGK